MRIFTHLLTEPLLHFLLIKGGEIIVREGTVFTAYVNRDVAIQLPSAPAPQVPQGSAPPEQPASQPPGTGE